MTYNLLLVEPQPLAAIATALARCLAVGTQEVDIADEDTDPDLRNWDALVLCEQSTLAGEVSSSLDIYVQDSVRPQPAEPELAASFAQSANTVVLFPAEEDLPSAYWLAMPDGSVTRARLYASDDDVPRYTIDAVETLVPQLPDVPVTRIAEVVREQHIPTPLTDTFAAYLERLAHDESATPGTLPWLARTRLGAWEKLVRQMADDWAPSGWYPPDLYRERLESRDELEQLRHQLPENIQALLQDPVEELDAQFTELTVSDPGAVQKALVSGDAPGTSTREWWWRRRPDPLPW